MNESEFYDHRLEVVEEAVKGLDKALRDHMIDEEKQKAKLEKDLLLVKILAAIAALGGGAQGLDVLRSIFGG